jgi:uncharacterized protein (TIGR00299 family) protein
MRIRLDPVGGIAGDMFVAAILDTFPELIEPTLVTISGVGLPEGMRVTLESHRDGVFVGRRLKITESNIASDRDHQHRTFQDVVDHLTGCSLEPTIREHSLDIFTLLAHAEAEVHGKRPEEVTFHEIGSWDSIVDIVAAAAVIGALPQAIWDTGPVPIGQGRVETQHGWLPLPSPAATVLLRDFVCFQDGISGERTTPTGAAILKYLITGASAELRFPVQGLLRRSGIGFGTSRFDGISNVLRILVFETDPENRFDDWVYELKFEVDDQTPEDLASGIDNIRARPGVLDVLQVPVVGKKNRMFSQIQVLCRENALDDTITACLLETASIGLRWNRLARTRLPRTISEPEIAGESVKVKLARRPDGRISAKAEMDEIRGENRNHQTRQQRRQQAEDSALAETQELESGAEKSGSGEGKRTQ